MFGFHQKQKRGSYRKPVKRFLNVSEGYRVDLSLFSSSGERDAIIASSGMGKSWLTGVIVEESLRNNVLSCVIDPEGEYWTLAEKFPVLVVGGDTAHLPMHQALIELYIDTMLETVLSVVFDLSEYIDAQQCELYALIADMIFMKESQHKKKMRLIVEEAQIYAPQGLSSKGGEASQRIAKRGRKRGLDSLWATQRPQAIDKNVLSQCNRFWFGGIQSELDYKAIKTYVEQAGISFNDLKALHPGQFDYYSHGKTEAITVRKRYCRHGASTPGLTGGGASSGSIPTHPLVKELFGIIKPDVEAILANQVDNEEQASKEQAEIARLKELLEKKDRQIQELKAELNKERLFKEFAGRMGVPPGKPGSQVRLIR